MDSPVAAVITARAPSIKREAIEGGFVRLEIAEFRPPRTTTVMTSLAFSIFWIHVQLYVLCEYTEPTDQNEWVRPYDYSRTRRVTQ